MKAKIGLAILPINIALDSGPLTVRIKDFAIKVSAFAYRLGNSKKRVAFGQQLTK